MRNEAPGDVHAAAAQPAQRECHHVRRRFSARPVRAAAICKFVFLITPLSLIIDAHGDRYLVRALPQQGSCPRVLRPIFRYAHLKIPQLLAVDFFKLVIIL